MSQVSSSSPSASVSASVSASASSVRLVASDTAGSCRSTLGTYAECPLCGGSLFPEHAHFKCSGCGWRDSCCD